jgi:hypothetical protein
LFPAQCPYDLLLFIKEKLWFVSDTSKYPLWFFLVEESPFKGETVSIVDT